MKVKVHLAPNEKMYGISQPSGEIDTSPAWWDEFIRQGDPFALVHQFGRRGWKYEGREDDNVLVFSKMDDPPLVPNRDPLDWITRVDDH